MQFDEEVLEFLYLFMDCQSMSLNPVERVDKERSKPSRQSVKKLSHEE
jgi:hypothetical protein